MRSCTDEPTICVLGFRQFANGSEDLTLKTQLVVKKIILDFTTFKFAAKGKVIAYWRSIWVGIWQWPNIHFNFRLLMMLQFNTVNEENLKNILILVFGRMETDAYFYLYVCGKRRRWNVRNILLFGGEEIQHTFHSIGRQVHLFFNLTIRIQIGSPPSQENNMKTKTVKKSS